MIFTLKKSLILFSIGIIYLLYSIFILSPGSYKSFSLIDDGQTIQNNFYFQKCITDHDCGDLSKVLIEKEFGRFRPGYWTINYIVSLLTGLNPILQHEVRILLIGLFITLLCGFIVMSAGGSVIGIICAVIFLMTSFSLTENIVRLGPTEPYQVLFIAIFLIFANLRKKYSFWIAMFAFVVSCLIKETSFIVAIPIVVTSFLFSSEKKQKKLSIIYFVFGVLIFVVGRIIANPAGGNLVYVENFQLNINNILTNSIQYIGLAANITSPFLKIFFFLFITSLVLPKFKNIFINKDVVLWFLTFTLFILVLIPWKYILERYLFISIFSFAILIGLIISNIQKKLFEIVYFKKHRAIYLVSFVIFIILVGNILTDSFSISLAKSLNYRAWYSTFLKFERDQVQAIANVNTSIVDVNAKDNLDNWEVLYELPIHLKYIYNNKTQLVRIDSVPTSGVIFNRTSLDTTILPIDFVKSGYKENNSQTYTIKQIDPLDFKRLFLMRPIEAIQESGLKTSEIKYVWAIYIK